VTGLGQSHGIMVNYGYRLADIERNHEAYQTTGEITLSPQVQNA
jgi:malonyl-CoA decarboxylase